MRSIVLTHGEHCVEQCQILFDVFDCMLDEDEQIGCWLLALASDFDHARPNIDQRIVVRVHDNQPLLFHRRLYIRSIQSNFRGGQVADHSADTI